MIVIRALLPYLPRGRSRNDAETAVVCNTCLMVLDWSCCEQYFAYSRTRSERDEGPRRRGSQIQRDGEVVQDGPEAAQYCRVLQKIQQSAKNE